MPSQHKAFLYMLFMHSKSINDQAKAIELLTAAGPDFAENLKSSHRHKAIIEQFGRLLQRNQTLGRASSEAD
jgi:uncharacterized protein (DUF924 family)